MDEALLYKSTYSIASVSCLSHHAETRRRGDKRNPIDRYSIRIMYPAIVSNHTTQATVTVSREVIIWERAESKQRPIIESIRKRKRCCPVLCLQLFLSHVGSASSCKDDVIE